MGKILNLPHKQAEVPSGKGVEYTMDETKNNKPLASSKKTELETTSPRSLHELVSLSDFEKQRLAESLTTPPEFLQKLGSALSLYVQRAVVSNPNTPIETLLKLGRYFPTSLFENPTFELLALENLNFIEDIPLDTLRSLIQSENAPGFFLKLAAKHQIEEIAEMAKLHVNLSGEMTEKWREVAEKAIRQTKLEYDLIDEDWDPYRFLSNFSELMPSCIVNHRELGIYMGKNPRTPVNILEQFAIDRNVDFRNSVAQNPNAPTTILEQLADDTEEVVRNSVAENPSTPATILEKLANDKGIWGGNGTLARNPSTPATILEKLANHEDMLVRYRVAKNPNTPAHILHKYATDEDRMIRVYTAQNPNTSATTLKHLAFDRDEGVRGFTAQNPNTPVITLKQLTFDEDKSVRGNVARNPNTPPSILEEFATDDRKWIRKGVAENPSTPEEVLEKFVSDEDDEILQYVIYNPNLSPTLSEKIFAYGDNRLYDSIARNPNTPAKLLKKLAIDRSFWTRKNVAVNRNTPTIILKQLAADEHFSVRQSVIYNPKCTLEIKKIGNSLGISREDRRLTR